MNRQDFYLNLALELNQLKVPPELINTHIDQFKQYLQTLTEEDAEKQIASFGDVKKLAANIYRLLCGSDAPAAEEVQSRPDEPPETVYDAFRVEDGEPEEPGITAPASSELPIQETPILPPEEEIAEDALELDFNIFDLEEYVAPDPALFEEPGSASPTPAAPADGPADVRTPEVRTGRQAPAEESIKLFHGNNSPLFWILFCITLPITLPLFIGIMAAFGFTYLIIALLVAITFILIFAVAIAGALLALTGGLYGVGRLRAANAAIGLFELGLAVAITGATILLAYIFTQLSLRLLPKLFVYLTRLLRFFLRHLLLLIQKIKKECAHK